MTSRLARSASASRPMSISGAGAAGQDPGQQPGVAGLPGGRLGPLREPQLLGELAVGAGVLSECMWYAAASSASGIGSPVSAIRP